MTIQSAKKENPYLSVVVPFFNEEESIERLWSALKNSLDEFGRPYEVIFVDDGSTDRTRDIMRQLASDNEQVRVILFRANFGQSAAMAAGFEATRGDVVVAIDGDLQNDPRDISAIVAKLNEGYDVVSGWRKNRQDKMVSRLIPSKIANHIICSVTDVKLHDTGCSLKAFRGELLRRISLYGELHRFIPALLRMEGARITEMPVRHHARRYGTSKYNLSRTFRVIMDLMTIRLLMRHLHYPLSFFVKFSLLAGLAGTATFLRALAQIVFNRIDVAAFNVSIAMTVLLWATGFMFMSLGLVGKMIVDNGDRRPFSLD